MRVTILGCGTSTGVPIIGCKCAICSSDNQRNKRTRSSALVEANGSNILIDTSTDLRTQCLANGIERMDAVLYTHAHADHMHGIDDLRAFNLFQSGPIPVYGSPKTLKRVSEIFSYVFDTTQNESWKPNLAPIEVSSTFKAAGVEILPVEVMHGASRITAYRIGNFAYATDCSSIPDESMEKLLGLDLLVLGALRRKPHPTHFTIDQAIEASRALKAKRTILTHLGHNVDYEEDSKTLPDGVELGYDGMKVDL